MAASVTQTSCRKAIVPEWREGTGSLGSSLVAVRGGSPKVLEAIVAELGERFRKSWYDLADGIAVFMAPSQTHEFTSHHISDLVEALSRAMNIKIVAIASTTVRTGDGEKSADPDESFLVGARAEQFINLMSQESVEAALAEFEGQPADLVVEVEHTHYDPRKVAVYRATGVKELWELAIRSRRRSPRIYDLQARGGARQCQQSKLLPGVRAECLPDALADLLAIGGVAELAAKVERGEDVAERLLKSAGVSNFAKR